jgi:major membrane immunogen (membrane-anchored lipoprotein)
MKILSRILAMLLLALIVGCGKDDKPSMPVETGLLKTQLETLEKAKQVEQGAQEAEEQQRQQIEQETK